MAKKRNNDRLLPKPQRTLEPKTWQFMIGREQDADAIVSRKPIPSRRIRSFTIDLCSKDCTGGCRADLATKGRTTEATARIESAVAAGRWYERNIAALSVGVG
ncbi:hypothetical protein B296_00021082 [Ensete ventricosum]|uniref:Uncharacterized protein n=1 Tax=Ensete ventricosum TaxID=4639 RepID=A0A427ALH4_ENSVE|nr:hypothetical protein B296_00021082 [Ensete ventricosum]